MKAYKYISRWAEESNLRLFKIGSSFSKDYNFICNLYEKEEKPIFEHSPYHVLSYLQYGNKLFGVVGNFGATILVVGKTDQFLFTPKVLDYKEFYQLVKSILTLFSRESLMIRNVSESWLRSFTGHFGTKQNLKIKVIPRSKEEAIYSVDLLTLMPGKEFSKLRQTRNKLLNKGLLSFREIVGKKDLSDSLKVLDKWNQVQGYKYTKKKINKEKYVLERFFSLRDKFDHVVFGIGYIGDKPLSVYLMYRIPKKPNYGTIYILKGINRKSEGGRHGISDATYCYCFFQAKKWGIKFINDGELGSEVGTRVHKLGFKPIEFLKSFDVLLEAEKIK